MDWERRVAAERLAEGMAGFFCVAVIALVVAVACGIIGAVIGESKRRAGLGFLVGFLFGPFGVLIACFLPPAPRVSTVSFRPASRSYPPAGCVAAAIAVLVWLCILVVLAIISRSW